MIAVERIVWAEWLLILGAGVWVAVWVVLALLLLAAVRGADEQIPMGPVVGMTSLTVVLVFLVLRVT